MPKTQEQTFNELETILFNLSSQRPSDTVSYSHAPSSISDDGFNENKNYFPVVLNVTQYESPPSVRVVETTPTPKRPSFLEDHLDLKIKEQLTQLLKSRNNPKNKSSVSDHDFSFLKQQQLNSREHNSSEKLDHLLMSFDHIDSKSNTLEVTSSKKDVFFSMKIANRTDIFKGVKNGAVYLHSKTSFTLNLNEYSSDFCLTSSVNKPSVARAKFKKLKAALSSGILNL